MLGIGIPYLQIDVHRHAVTVVTALVHLIVIILPGVPEADDIVIALVDITPPLVFRDLFRQARLVTLFAVSGPCQLIVGRTGIFAIDIHCGTGVITFGIIVQEEAVLAVAVVEHHDDREPGFLQCRLMTNPRLLGIIEMGRSPQIGVACREAHEKHEEHPLPGLQEKLCSVHKLNI